MRKRCESDTDFMSHLHKITQKDEKSFVNKSRKIAPVAAANAKKQKKIQHKEGNGFNHSGLLEKLRAIQAELPASWSKVSTDEKDDGTKTILVNPHRSVFGKMRGGNDMIKVNISALFYETISGANAANATVRTLLPNACPDAITLSLVYDECRTVGFTLKVRADCITTATSVPAGPTLVADAIVAFDPANPNAYGSVDTAIDAQHHTGPHNTRAGASPSGYGPDFHTMSVKIPKPIVDPNLTPSLVGSNWTVAIDTTPIVGYLKPYTEAAGAGTSIVLSEYLIYHMEFRART